MPKPRSTPKPRNSRTKARSKNIGLSWRWRKFGSRARAIMVIGLVATVGIIATLITHAQQLGQEETVTLSNGKEVRLGQSTQSLSDELGGQLYKLSPEQYEYPGQPNQPIEAVFDITQDQVVVIHVLNSLSNTTKAIRAQRSQLKLSQMPANDARAKAVSGMLAGLRPRALAISQSRSVQYFIPDPCADNDQIHLVSLALKGAENRVAEDMGGEGCHAE